MRPRFLPHSLLIFALLVTVFLFGRFNHAAAQLPPLTDAELTAAGVDPALLRAAALAVTVSASNNSPTILGQTTTLTATVNVTDTSGLSFSWILGDGQAANGAVVRHTYPGLGEYEAWVIVSDGTATVSARTRVKIEPVPPPPRWAPEGLQAGSDAPQEAGRPIRFWATVTKGTDVVYTWDYGDGSPRETGAVVSHIYPTPGFYAVNVIASNDLGSAPQRTIIVKVTEASIEELDFTYTPANIVVGSPVEFQATVTRGTNIRYEWSFGDGTLDPSGAASVSHTFTEKALREVRVRALNQVSDVTKSKSVVVGSTPPTNLDLSVTEPLPPTQAFSFKVEVNSLTPVQIYWNFGDGQLQVSTPALVPGTTTLYQQRETHIYRGSRKYPLVVTVHNDAGSIQDNRVIYAEVPRMVQRLQPSYAPQPPKVGQPIFFSVPVGANQECGWEFKELEVDATAIGNPVVHIFTAPGFYVVSVTCTNPLESALQAADFIILVTIDTYMPIIAGGNASAANIQPTPEPTIAPIPTATNTPTPTATPTDTPTATATPTATPTPTATVTPTPLPTATSTETPTATATPTPTETVVPTETVLPTPTDTATPVLGGTIPQQP